MALNALQCWARSEARYIRSDFCQGVKWKYFPEGGKSVGFLSRPWRDRNADLRREELRRKGRSVFRTRPHLRTGEKPDIFGFMKSLRRYPVSDRPVFITGVTHLRRPILLDHPHLFLDCWLHERPLAWVVLPDHFHVIIDPTREKLSQGVHLFKVTYSRRYRAISGPGRVWQNRFWDHILRDETDLQRHLDYIHYNPVKHGLVSSPLDYSHLSFSKFIAGGYYTNDWGMSAIEFGNEKFGE